ncbi:uncharacterized protein [Clytia hemisphaerica]|uniref:uncharacterized protein n=1 Tax=Clytia hemisphaerica TaxID=252671 RepID=UPI0034D6F13D
MKSAHKLAVCCLNISEGSHLELINEVAQAAVERQDQWPSTTPSPFKCKSTVLSVYSDRSFNRGNITIASSIEHLAKSVYHACAKVFQTIDLQKHSDVGHPRLGAVDLIPIHPISPQTSLQDCAGVAHQIADLITTNIPGSSLFYFGKADHKERDLVQRRKEMSWFTKDSEISRQIIPDVGTYSPKYGISAIGAIPYMSVLNVLLDTDDLVFGRFIASEIRQRNINGLDGIQAMAFLKGRKVEIACNVDTNDLQSKLPVFKTSFEDLESRIASLAREKNVRICGESVRGFTPQEAYMKAEQALLSGDVCPWKHYEIDVM